MNAIKQKLTATKANMDTMASMIPDSRQDIRQQLVASSGMKGGSLAEGTKRKSCGSLDVAGTCWYSMVIPNFNGFVIPKWSWLRGVPLVETDLVSQKALPPPPLCLCHPSC